MRQEVAECIHHKNREKYVVISNFRALDLQMSADSPFGLRALKGFLEYAETGHFETRSVPLGDYCESAFEDAVARFLT